LAEWTGLEPATPGVTGRYSNQLNYHSSQAGPVDIVNGLAVTSSNEETELVGAERLELPT
jgi:hypothetical protein